MKLAIITLLLLCSLSITFSQICYLKFDCTGCLTTSGCSWCVGPADYCSSNCTTGFNPVATCPAPVDITTNANFTCFSAADALLNVSVLGEFAFNLDISTISGGATNISAQVIAYTAAGLNSKPALFGFQYVDLSYQSQPSAITVDGLAVFYSLLNAFEFMPNNAQNAFTTASTKIGTPIIFTNPTVSPCSNATIGGVVYNYITFTYPNGWSVSCKFTNTPVTTSAGISLSPISSKCDVTFGAFTYSGQSGTRLGVTVVFAMAAVSVAASTNPQTGIKPCPHSGICMIIGGAKKSGVFTWVSTTTGGSDVVSSGITAYEGGSGDFYIPASPGTSGLGSSIPGGSADVTAFAASNIVVFSFANPKNGDVWDPQLQVVDASTLNSGSNMITYSFILIIAALFIKFL